METQANTNQKTQKPQFTRKARLGVNPITIPDRGTKYLEITSEKLELFERKNDDAIDFVHVTDMENGEEGHFWLSGGLKYQLEQVLETRKTLKGFKMEITHKGKSEIETEIDGKKQKVMANQYDMYELN